MTSRWRTALSLVALVAFAAGGFWLGARLGEQASEPGMQVLSLDRPSTIPPREAGLRSPAGFSGFEDGALPGLVARAGTVTASDDSTLVVESGSARTEVRYTSPTRFLTLLDAGRALQAGDVVVIRTAADGSAEAVLVVPGDIREGDAR